MTSAPLAAAFAPAAKHASRTSGLRVVSGFDPMGMADMAAASSAGASFDMSSVGLDSHLTDAAASIAVSNSFESFAGIASVASSSSSNLLSFADQGQNLAGVFFQASLLPYLAFLYFLSFRGNRTPSLGNFGWQFLLLFVLSTIPGGIISKSTYGVSLADCDWLHGSAEALLTATNVLIVLGFKEAMTKSTEEIDAKKNDAFKLAAVGGFGLFAAFAALGPGTLGFEAHSPFLFGIGGLGEDAVAGLPWVIHSEPENALSIPTWAIHFSSVFEFLFAMGIIWDYAEATDNPKWKGLTWGMLPLHASGIAACTYHFFYNPSSLQFLVSTQAGLTLLGNITVAIAAFRIAASNGWTIGDLNPFPKSNTSPEGIVVDELAAAPVSLVLREKTESTVELAAKLAALTLGASYAVKYGELALDLPFEPNAFAGAAIVAGIPALTAFQFYNRSQKEGGEGEGEGGFSIPGFGGGGEDGEQGLSMADVKKYGVAGTLAYVITELAFWAVAFPVASTAYYNTAGHWPDVINDSSDRTTVLGFIFAGANVARLLVPLRLGAALALAPWVDENILGGEAGKEEQ
eukprot:CAMPEP_0113539248 /NCGR_PEP_ID=MMETSP0015_2-20120614/7813_1 /TAXON_ID=2838 /ORGANISM="Odontella" /LENGTH=573 /DNA_ID=CAMNT_0000438907 /DNA_START=53 /DNA_END=1774 /DNA_ORIENTATION=- /assembly_acc=CAM_ASM_000160